MLCNWKEQPALLTSPLYFYMPRSFLQTSTWSINKINLEIAKAKLMGIFKYNTFKNRFFFKYFYSININTTSQEYVFIAISRDLKYQQSYKRFNLNNRSIVWSAQIEIRERGDLFAFGDSKNSSKTYSRGLVTRKFVRTMFKQT